MGDRPADPTDYEAAFIKQREIVHQYRDLLDNAAKDAESILRPYLTTAGVFGITPDHRFREIEQLPLRLAEAIATALAASRAGQQQAEKT